MTYITKLVLLTCCIVLGSSRFPAQSKQGCDESRLRVRYISDFERAAVRKTIPAYPPDAKQKGVEGTVRLKLFVDKLGHVRLACPVYSDEQPRPDSSLVEAAQKAALKWKFLPNFGLHGKLNLQFDYVALFIAFKFALSEPPALLEGKAPDREHEKSQAHVTTDTLKREHRRSAADSSAGGHETRPQCPEVQAATFSTCRFAFYSSPKRRSRNG